MPDFRCRLGTATGEIVERDHTAADAGALKRELERQDYLVLSIQARSSLASAAVGMLRRRRRVNTGDFLVFNQEFAALIRAGLPIIECLTLLVERRRDPVFRAALEAVRDRVRAGESLSDAFAADELFPPLYASTLASGERSGEIATVLTRYVQQARTILAVKRRVIAALTYPAILLTVALGVVTLLLTWLLPRFQVFFQGMGAELPLITRLVMGLSTVVRGYVLVWAPALVLGALIFVVWRRTPRGRRAVEVLSYKTPLVGPIARQFAVTRFARTLSTLVAGGIPLPTCLEIVSRSMGAAVYSTATSAVGAKIREGAALWSSLEETALFPDLMVEMVKVGESSGSVAEMLAYVADFIDQEIDLRLQRLVSLIEPAMLLGMAVIVGTLLLSIYYPLLQVYAASTQGGI